MTVGLVRRPWLVPLGTVLALVVAVLTWVAAGATAGLTAVLAMITAYYAFETHRMVGEMRASRALSIRPKLAVRFESVGPDRYVLAVTNVGLGAAMDVDVTLMLHARDATDDYPGYPRRWRTAVLMPGERELFTPEAHPLPAERIVRSYASVTLSGSYHDGAGDRIEAAHSIDDLAEWLQLHVGAELWWEEPPLERMAAAVERAGDALERRNRHGA